MQGAKVLNTHKAIPTLIRSLLLSVPDHKSDLSRHSCYAPSA